MLVQVEIDSEVQDNLKLVLENARGNKKTARLKFSFPKKDIYAYIYLADVKLLNASRSPVVLFHQNLHCMSAAVNLTCSLLKLQKRKKRQKFH